MAKNLKLNIKNTQIAQAINLGNIKKALNKSDTAEESKGEAIASPTAKITSKAPETKASAETSKAVQAKDTATDTSKSSKNVKAAPGSKSHGKQPPVEEEPEVQHKARARSRSAFAEPHAAESTVETQTPPAEAEEFPSQETEYEVEVQAQVDAPSMAQAPEEAPEVLVEKTSVSEVSESAPKTVETPVTPIKTAHPAPQAKETPIHRPQENRRPDARAPDHRRQMDNRVVMPPRSPLARPVTPVKPPVSSGPKQMPSISSNLLAKKEHAFLKDLPVREKFGPTGKHINDLIPKKPVKVDPPPRPASSNSAPPARPRPPATTTASTSTTSDVNKPKAPSKFRDFKDVKPAPKKVGGDNRSFDSRDSRGLRGGSAEDDARWRKRRAQKQNRYEEDTTIRPTTLKVRLPIAIKDLAVEMKLKASQLVQKLFLQGIILTLNDVLEDEVTIALLGHEFGCEITIDKTEADRIQITDKTISQEVAESNPDELIIRPPVVTFMGHVDHGKTSLIDTIRKSNRASGEAGAITQHIGAFMCSTPVGDIAFLDTPGHEAFSAMRERGANVTDIVVLVVAGDEGIRQQTIEAINHAKAAGVTIVVAINKSDKPNFDADTIYRQLSEQELLPEKWGGQTITVNCSALTGDGIQELLEMLALQAEILELRASTSSRARGTVIESEMHKGLGSRATILVQNGTLKKGDALVFEHHWGRVKTMHNDMGKEVQTAGPSQPVEITGLSGLPDAGQEFIVVKSEKEAKEISAKRMEGFKQSNMLVKKKLSMENIFENAKDASKKVLNLVIRADVQGSLEALKNALEKIKSTKAELNIIYAGVGEVSESDVILAAASKGVVLGFHTQIESHAEMLVKEQGVVVKLHDIIYHAIDDIKLLMKNLLDKIPQETEKGKALVKATFKSSHLGTICGCQVTEGIIHRNNLIRVMRGKEMVYKGTIASLKKIKEDVREVPKGIECGILINNYNDALPDDMIEAYEITYLTQEL